jgi:hypothetical protein
LALSGEGLACQRWVQPLNSLFMRILSIFLLVATALQAGEPVSLFDGKTFSGWSGADGKAPGEGWVIEDGVLHLNGNPGGNLLSDKEYTNFEFSWEWKIEEGGNNGVKYWVTKVGGKDWLGIEYQMLDDAKHPDGKNGLKRQTASFYDIKEPLEDRPLKAPGEWNQSKIVALNGKLEHWLNGKLVGEADSTSPEWAEGIAGSKFKDKEGFAPGKGRLMLTDHKDKTWFRNLQIIER